MCRESQVKLKLVLSGELSRAGRVRPPKRIDQSLHRMSYSRSDNIIKHNHDEIRPRGWLSCGLRAARGGQDGRGSVTSLRLCLLMTQQQQQQQHAVMLSIVVCNFDRSTNAITVLLDDFFIPMVVYLLLNCLLAGLLSTRIWSNFSNFCS